MSNLHTLSYSRTSLGHMAIGSTAAFKKRQHYLQAMGMPTYAEHDVATVSEPEHRRKSKTKEQDETETVPTPTTGTHPISAKQALLERNRELQLNVQRDSDRLAAT